MPYVKGFKGIYKTSKNRLYRANLGAYKNRDCKAGRREGRGKRNLFILHPFSWGGGMYAEVRYSRSIPDGRGTGCRSYPRGYAENRVCCLYPSEFPRKKKKTPQLIGGIFFVEYRTYSKKSCFSFKFFLHGYQ